MVGREEAEREFGTLLVDQVKEFNVSRRFSPSSSSPFSLARNEEGKGLEADFLFLRFA